MLEVIVYIACGWWFFALILSIACYEHTMSISWSDMFLEILTLRLWRAKR